MKNFIIGVTPRLQKNNDNEIVQVNILYLQALTSRLLTPIILPLESDNLTQTLDLCDGFLMIGGNDIDPSYYNEENTGLSESIDERLDLVDKAVIEYAITMKKPLLGICRGLQAIAVFCGGSLHQDITSANLRHSHENKKHEVSRVASTNLTSRLPETFHINTYHHQAINKMPTSFKVIYQHEDIIEGIEHDYLPIIAFQWHPEKMMHDESSVVIFDYFLELIENYH